MSVLMLSLINNLGGFYFKNIFLDYSKGNPKLGLLRNIAVKYSGTNREFGLRSSRSGKVLLP